MAEILHFTDTPIPVHYSKLDGNFEPISIELLVMTGAADDEAVGAPGIMHWFEHVPFRGTHLFPKGKIELSPGFSQDGGSLNAYTSTEMTVYHAYVQKRFFREGLTVVTDLAARPLLRDEDIAAERTIIKQEIAQRLSDISGFAHYHNHHRLWGSHPYGHHTLGSAETLDSLTGDHLRAAHAQMYSRSRMQLFISGTLDPKEVERIASEILSVVPERPLSERRVPIQYGELPVWKPGREDITTSFDTSLVQMLFPIGPEVFGRTAATVDALGSVFSTGSLSSPLYRIVREERHLCYSVGNTLFRSPDGGYIGLVAKTQKDNVEKVIEALWDVIKEPELRTSERWDFCKRNMEAGYAMRLPHPAQETDRMISCLSNYGEVLTTDEEHTLDERVTQSESLALLDKYTQGDARIIVHLGR